MVEPVASFDRLVEERVAFTDVLLREEHVIASVARVISDAFSGGHRLFIFGNGGSAADAQHMAAELVGRFHPPEPGGWARRGLPALALTTDTSALTAIANDWCYAYVFQRQLEALGSPGDVALGITTSGASQSVVDALVHAAGAGMVPIVLVGASSPALDEACVEVVVVGPGRTPVVQERMLAVEHIVCELVEDRMRQMGVL